MHSVRGIVKQRRGSQTRARNVNDAHSRAVRRNANEPRVLVASFFPAAKVTSTCAAVLATAGAHLRQRWHANGPAIGPCSVCVHTRLAATLCGRSRCDCARVRGRAARRDATAELGSVNEVETRPAAPTRRMRARKKEETEMAEVWVARLRVGQEHCYIYIHMPTARPRFVSAERCVMRRARPHRRPCTQAPCRRRGSSAWKSTAASGQHGAIRASPREAMRSYMCIYTSDAIGDCASRRPMCNIAERADRRHARVPDSTPSIGAAKTASRALSDEIQAATCFDLARLLTRRE